MSRLVGVELRRLLARRTFRLLMLVLALGILGVMIGIAVHSNRELAAAHARAAQLARQAVASGPAGPGGGPGPAVCGPGPNGQTVCRGPTAADFYTDPRFFFASAGDALVNGPVVAVALLGLLIGGSAIGAEWGAGTLTALLTWEPRRLRVFAAKTFAAVAVMLAVAVVAIAITVGAGALIAATRGSLAHSTGGLVMSLVLRGLRGLVLVGLLTAVGTAIAGLTRHTVSALVVAVAYLVGVEIVLAHVHPEWDRWLLTSNAQALISDRTQHLSLSQPGRTFGRMHSFALSPTRGVTELLVVAAVLLVAHAVTFSRRDAI